MERGEKSRTPSPATPVLCVLEDFRAATKFAKQGHKHKRLFTYFRNGDTPKQKKTQTIKSTSSTSQHRRGTERLSSGLWQRSVESVDSILGQARGGERRGKNRKETLNNTASDEGEREGRGTKGNIPDPQRLVKFQPTCQFRHLPANCIA
jgi:hypothetical protein